MTLAAIDLGSNRFHMVVAHVNHNEMRPVEAFAERIQLVIGYGKNSLSLEAIARGLTCLSCFRQVLDTLKPDRVRVVGINALRAAKNVGVFRCGAYMGGGSTEFCDRSLILTVSREKLTCLLSSAKRISKSPPCYC